jgi:chorismate dehydratase
MTAPGIDLVRLGAVSYLNTLPLIEGLGKLADVSLTLTAPSRLIDLLMDGTVDLALASVIDAQRSPRAVALVPAGMIGCDGPTMTVRLFSRVPAERITKVHADVDSHTSIALLRVILAERFGVHPELIDFDADAHRADAARSSGAALDATAWPESLLMIGDKVVTDSPPAILYPHQLDLGQAWHAMTGMPFVYAVWMCREGEAASEAVRAAAAVLDRQRRHNATRLDWIVAARAPSRGWPAEVARDYLGGLLRYEVTPESRLAIARFFELCNKHGVLGSVREVRWADMA